MLDEPTATAEMFKALGDPIRWSIMHQIAEADELAASVLADTLPISKPTISYHTKILVQAGLVEVHKRGRNYFYRLRRDALNELLGQIGELLPGPHALGRTAEPPTARKELRKASGDDAPVSILTW